MTRPSKREVERSIESLDESNVAAQGESTLEIKEKCPESVVDLARNTFRELLWIVYDHDTGVVNKDEPAATLRYLSVIRERYDIVPERDEEVYDSLADIASKSDTREGCYMFFASSSFTLPVVLKEQGDDSLRELVDEGKQDAAENVLVERIYTFHANGRIIEGGGGS